MDEIKPKARKGRTNRMKRARELGAEYFMNVCDGVAGDEYPVYVYPGQDLNIVKKQFRKTNFEIVKVDYD